MDTPMTGAIPVRLCAVLPPGALPDNHVTFQRPVLLRPDSEAAYMPLYVEITGQNNTERVYIQAFITYSETRFFFR